MSPLPKSYRYSAYFTSFLDNLAHHQPPKIRCSDTILSHHRNRLRSIRRTGSTNSVVSRGHNQRLPSISISHYCTTVAGNNMTGKEYSIYKPKDNAIVESKVQIPTLGPKDVLIRITHSGVCYADASFAKRGLAIALGHEGVGVVETVGSEVTQFKVGERAGGGFHRDSCGKCRYCLSSQDILCSDRVLFGGGDADNGTFARYFVGKETYVHRIPDAIASEHAGPLQCAGATTFKALKATIGPGKRVGVLGIGGLGHLAIQFAARMGATVVALSTTREKETEALEMGAKEFASLDQWNVKAPLDVVVLTSSKYPDFDK